MLKTSDKLRWYRYKRGLLQKDVAAYLGISENSYLDYEKTERQRYNHQVMQKLSILYGIPIEDLLDDYNLFLYHGQAQQIKAYIRQEGITITEYAAKHGMQLQALLNWEKGKKTISKSKWEQYFKHVQYQ